VPVDDVNLDEAEGLPAGHTPHGRSRVLAQ
jgi:hypothetical protein